MSGPIDGTRTWTNWAGNQSFSAHVAAPASEDDVVALVRAALADGSGVRAAGAGHSFTPVIETTGTVLTTARLRGIERIDAGRRHVTALPGTTVGEFGEPLWAAGLALANQGDIDTQAIAGAVATGTHGSGLALPSFSATLRACRLVNGHGEVTEIDGSVPELLRAAQVSVGMLGVMTSLTLEVASAYRLRERIDHQPFTDVIAQWDELVAGHRHFSFFWLPSEQSARLYNLATPPGARDDGHLLREALRRGGRRGRGRRDARSPGRSQLPHLPVRLRGQLPRARVLRAARARP
jgi:FAD/FMN-containing dehydrogenase